MTYFVVFFLSCAFFWLSEKSRSKYVRAFWAFIALLLPCLLAGMRADTVGTDVKVYVEPMYNAAKASYSIASYMEQKWYVIWRYMYVKKFEIGFSLIIFVIEKFGGSLGTVLFVIQALIITPIYLGLKKIRKPYSICFGMFVFYCMFYNTSLNMMRQWIAMAIMFLGFSYLINSKKKKYCAFILVACLFHTSAIVGIAVLLVYLYSTKKREYIKIAHIKLNGSLVPIKVFVYGCIALLSLNIVAMILGKIGLSKYIVYIQGRNGLHILPNQIILRLPVIILFVARWKKICKEDVLAPFYGSMIVLDLLFSQLISINAYATRIASFFSEYNMISYSAIVYAGNRKYRANRYMTLLYMLVYMISYWIYYYAITGAGETFPYVFA